MEKEKRGKKGRKGKKRGKREKRIKEGNGSKKKREIFILFPFLLQALITAKKSEQIQKKL